MSAFNLPQFTQMHSRIFLTLTRKPTKQVSHANTSPRLGRTNVENRAGEFNVAKVAWTLGHALATCLTLEVAIYCSQAGIHKPSNFHLARALLQHLGKLDLAYRVRFLCVGSRSNIEPTRVATRQKLVTNSQFLREIKCQTGPLSLFEVERYYRQTMRQTWWPSNSKQTRENENPNTSAEIICLVKKKSKKPQAESRRAKINKR